MKNINNDVEEQYNKLFDLVKTYVDAVEDHCKLLNTVPEVENVDADQWDEEEAWVLWEREADKCFQIEDQALNALKEYIRDNA